MVTGGGGQSAARTTEGCEIPPGTTSIPMAISAAVATLATTSIR